MRIILALLAVIGLLASPAVAAAAQAACHQQSAAKMADMAMGGAPGMAKADPCCDPGAGKDLDKSKDHNRGCLHVCVTLCGVVAALPSTPAALPEPPSLGPPESVRLASLKPGDPRRLERPPRSIA
jgi:hypothetical protein